MWTASEDPAFCYSVPEPRCDSKTPASSLIHVLPLHKKNTPSFSKTIQLYKSLHVCSNYTCFLAWIRTGNKKGAELQGVVRWPRFFIKGSTVTASGNHARSLSGACRWLSAPGRELRGSFVSWLFGSSLQTGPHRWAPTQTCRMHVQRHTAKVEHMATTIKLHMLTLYTHYRKFMFNWVQSSCLVRDESSIPWLITVFGHTRGERTGRCIIALF